jgi:hypothetical protein
VTIALELGNEGNGRILGFSNMPRDARVSEVLVICIRKN